MTVEPVSEILTKLTWGYTWLAGEEADPELESKVTALEEELASSPYNYSAHEQLVRHTQ